ncbi:MAG: hypothetical protein NTY82_04750 [Actinobacteria bacterium]|nr:hypothetical protein [Actinomycetota bacterium]
MENQIFRIIFVVFVGLMVTFFVGFGIDAFYPEPVYPQAIQDMWTMLANKTPTVEEQAKINALEQAYQLEQQTHNRIVSIVVTIAAVIFLALSVLLENKNRVMANGIMLGGLFSLLYGAARGLGSQDSMVTFITVGVGLAAVVLIGLRRFSHARETSSAQRD